MEWLMDIGKQYGPFAMLVAYILWFFDGLIKQMRKENAERETKYQMIIKSLTDDVKDRLVKIENTLRAKRRSGE